MQIFRFFGFAICRSLAFWFRRFVLERNTSRFHFYKSWPLLCFLPSVGICRGNKFCYVFTTPSKANSVSFRHCTWAQIFAKYIRRKNNITIIHMDSCTKHSYSRICLIHQMGEIHLILCPYFLRFKHGSYFISFKIVHTFTMSINSKSRIFIWCKTVVWRYF
jgi:hypothetical protein